MYKLITMQIYEHIFVLQQKDELLFVYYVYLTFEGIYYINYIRNGAK